MQVRPFRIAVPDDAVDDLRDRLRRTRLPDQIPGTAWEYGTDTGSLAELLRYWGSDYDWRAQERSINDLPHFKVEIAGADIHFVHVRGERRQGEPPPIPLLMLHGWPGSFLQMIPTIEALTRPAAGEGPVFDVIVPSLPGFGFSSIPTERGVSTARIGPLMHGLMSALRYDRYAMRSGDLGAGVASSIATAHPEAIIGSHTGGTNPYLAGVPDDLSPAEQDFVRAAQAWMQSEMAYAMLHSSKPQTIAHALMDSPAGLAAWILEKVWRWGDSDIPLTVRFDRDALLDNLSLYWFTGTIASSMRLYYETARAPAGWAVPDVPTAFLMSSRDMFPTPRSWVARQGRIDRWSEIDVGGHFLEWEVPGIVVDDLRAFFGPLAR